MELGLLLLRLVLAAVLAIHAVQKVLGWFNGPGLTKATMIFESLGQRPGRRMVLLAATCELGAAGLLTLGLATPLAGAIAAGTMLVAGASMSWARGTVWNAAGGGEYPLALAAFALVPAFTGAGDWSLDAAFDLPWAELSNGDGAGIGLAAAAVALSAAVPPLLRTRRHLASASAPKEPAQAGS